MGIFDFLKKKGKQEDVSVTESTVEDAPQEAAPQEDADNSADTLVEE